MKPNTDYGDRPVTVDELVAAFGTAAAAYRATVGQNRLALYYLNNPHLIADAPKVSYRLAGEMADELRRRREQELRAAREADEGDRVEERRRKARAAWGAKGTILAVMRACHCSQKTARVLLEEAGFMMKREATS